MLNVQKYLQDHTLDDLESQLGIITTRYTDRVVLNYSQLDSPKFHPICDECRGLILSLPNLKVLSRSFDRFYNLGERGYFSDDQFCINRMEVQQKIDGSLIDTYNDGHKWCCATRKMAFAEGETPKGNTFKPVVEKALGFPVEDLEYKLTDEMKDYTIICEMVSPETRVVIPYPEYKLYVLAIRNKYTGEYLDREDIDNIVYNYWLKEGPNLDRPDIYTFKSIEDCIKASNELKPMDYNGEGYVCCDVVTNNRVKIKNPAYVAIHHLRENVKISTNCIIDLVFEQEYDEYLEYFPEDTHFFQPYIDGYHNMIRDIKQVWDSTHNIEDQKEFALQVKDKPFSGILFNMRKGKSISEALDKLTRKSRQRLINNYVK